VKVTRAVQVARLRDQMVAGSSIMLSVSLVGRFILFAVVTRLENPS
jgi:hypothetical protein